MTTIALLGVGGLACGVAGLFVAVQALRRVSRLQAESATKGREIERMAEGSVDPRAIRNVAMVRYDAFRDMGGRLSFSLALLDAGGDGVLLTSINAHSETRTYAKVIYSGESSHDLSPEEEQVLAAARNGKGARTTTGTDTPGIEVH